MAIQICTKCGHAVNDKESVCPQCGTPQKKESERKKSQKIIVFGCVFLSIVAAFFIGNFCLKLINPPVKIKFHEITRKIVGEYTFYAISNSSNDYTYQNCPIIELTEDDLEDMVHYDYYAYEDVLYEHNYETTQYTDAKNYVKYCTEICLAGNKLEIRKCIACIPQILQQIDSDNSLKQEYNNILEDLKKEYAQKNRYPNPIKPWLDIDENSSIESIESAMSSLSYQLYYGNLDMNDSQLYRLTLLRFQKLVEEKKNQGNIY